MDEKRAVGQRAFDEFADDFLGRPGVDRRPMFGSVGLAVGGKFFAFVGGDGKLVVKLPAARAKDLVEAGTAEPVTLGRRTMREWIALPVPDDPESWRPYVSDAHDYVLALQA